MAVKPVEAWPPPAVTETLEPWRDVLDCASIRYWLPARPLAPVAVEARTAPSPSRTRRTVVPAGAAAARSHVAAEDRPAGAAAGIEVDGVDLAGRKGGGSPGSDGVFADLKPKLSAGRLV